MKTALFAMRLAAVAYLLPFFFVFEPGLLLEGQPASLILVVAGATIGVLSISAGLAGFLVTKLGALIRIVLVGVGLFALSAGTSSWWYAAAAWAAAGAVVVANRRRRLASSDESTVRLAG